MSCGTCGSPLPPAAGGAGAVGSGPPCPPSPHNCITGIWIINGGSLTQDSVNQYVNLPQNQQYVDYVTENVDRLSNRVRVFVTSQLPSPVSFRLRAIPQTADAGYTPSEIAANPNYDCPETGVSGASPRFRDGSYGVETSVSIAVKGGEEFRIVAECTETHCGQSFSVGTITVRRRLWLLPVAMRRSDGLISIPNLTSFKDYFRDFLYIDCAELTRQEIPCVVYRSQAAEREILGHLSTPFSTAGAPDKEPYVVVFVFADQLADKVEFPYRFSNQTLIRSTGNHEIALSRYIWWDMGGPGGEWFVSGRFYATGIGSVDFSGNWRNIFTPLPGSPTHARNRLRMNVGPIFAALDSRRGRVAIGDSVTGTIEITVNCPDGFLGGYTYYNGNVILMATRSYWEDMLPAQLIQVMRHEFGHTITMVSDADRDRSRGLDPGPKQYIGRGHQGSHCSYMVSDIPAGTDYGSTHNHEARCNMYGATNANFFNNIMNFCPTCLEAVKKMDLNPGWSGTYTHRSFFGVF